MNDLKDMQQQARLIKDRYDEINVAAGRSTWSGLDFAAGFGGDYGDLVKLVMAKEGKRTIEDLDAKLEHELADCLWSVLVLADHYDIDIEAAFVRTMQELKERLADK